MLANLPTIRHEPGRVCKLAARVIDSGVLAAFGVLLLLLLPVTAAVQTATPAASELDVVDCLLPGRVQKLGNRVVFVGKRRPIKTVAVNCEIRGGEYTAFDRASLSTSLGIWLDQATAGDAEAQNYVGEIYERGLGTEPDHTEAAKWYALAAEQGLTPAQFNLGKLYESGLGVELDKAKALHWYREASGLPSLVERPDLQPALPDPAGTAPPSLRIEMIDPLVPETRGLTIATVSGDVIERLIIGRVRSEEALRTVMVNDREVSFESNGIFQTRVPVGSESTRISIVAIDNAGRRGSRDFILEPSSRGSSQNPVLTANYGNYHALVIGNNDYKFMNPLSTAVNDARAIGQILEQRYGFKVTHLEDATRARIMGALNELRKTLTENDNLLIYYAGHGTLDETNDRGHWLPVDAKPDDTTEWLSNIALTDLLNIMAARHILVVADSCYAGALTRSAATSLRSGEVAADVAALTRKRSRTALTSGGLMPVLDRGRGGHSVFAGALIDALRENSDVVDGQRLMLKIRSIVASAAYDRSNFEQVPVYAPINLAGHELGEFFFVPDREQT